MELAYRRPLTNVVHGWDTTGELEISVVLCAMVIAMYWIGEGRLGQRLQLEPWSRAGCAPASEDGLGPGNQTSCRVPRY